MMHAHNSFRKSFLVSQKTFNFAPTKQKSEVMSSLHHKATFAAQKNFSSVAFFMPVYLVNPNNCVTHTHTHIRATALKW